MKSVGGVRLIRGIANAVASVHPALFEARVMDALERNARRSMSEACVPGLQFAMAVADRPVRQFCAGCGDAGMGTGDLAPLSHRTPFRVASLSKPISAMIVLRMAASGVVNLDAPVGHLLEGIDSLAEHREALHAMTLRLLLSHASGIADQNMPHVFEGQPAPTLEATLNGALGPEGVPRFERRPGEKTTYSGLNYALLELVLVGLLGKEFEVLAREHLFEPLGMTCTFAREARTKRGVAVEHDHVGAKLGHQIPVAVAASGLVANATEVAKLLREGVEAAWGDANRVMSPESARLLFTLQSTEHPISKFAIGFHRIRDTEPPVFDHHGHRPGLRCEVNVIPEARVTVVAMCNGERGESVNQPILSMIRGICSKQGSTTQCIGR